MKFAVISAGEGSRLAQEGSLLPKPLVRIGGRPMIGRLLDIMKDAGAGSIAVIVNPANTLTLDYLNDVRQKYNLDIVVKSTPGPMHSLYGLTPFLRGEKFCVTTVDTVFRESEFHDYLDAFASSDRDGMMGVTDYVDDEKPLYVGTDAEMNITGFHDEPSGCRFVSAGIYGLDGRALEVLERCVSSGRTRMRDFQRQLLADGVRLKGYRFGKVIDVDHVGDIAKAGEISGECENNNR